mgnify:CR=1 FL=1
MRGVYSIKMARQCTFIKINTLIGGKKIPIINNTLFTLLYGYNNNKDIQNIIMNMVWIFGLVVLTYISDVMVYKLYKK